MQIRTALPEELPILENLARAIWPLTYKDIISSEQIAFMLDWMYSTPLLLKQQREGHEFYILDTKGQDVAFMALEWTDEQSKLKINKLYVLPSFHGKGIGKKLIEKSIERAEFTGVKQIYLQVNKDNKAVEFYKKVGFHIEKEAIFDIGHGFVMDDYIMAYSL